MKHRIQQIKLFALTFIALGGLVMGSMASAASSSLNPETSGVDIQATSPVNSNAQKSETSLKNSCREQWTGARAYDVEFCKKKCANGEKRFCACAKNPCAKYEKEFEAEATKPAPAPSPNDTTKPKDETNGNQSGPTGNGTPRQCMDILTADGPNYKYCSNNNSLWGCQKWVSIPWSQYKSDCDKGVGQYAKTCKPMLCNKGCVDYCGGNFPEPHICQLRDEQLPTTVEGKPLSEFTEIINKLAGESNVDALKRNCRMQYNWNSFKSCTILCKAGCGEYCNYCKLGGTDQGPGRGLGGGTGAVPGQPTHQWLTQSLVAHTLDSDETWQHRTLLHNCNPATKKRGVGLQVLGMPEDFLGVKYGDTGSVGYCHELLPLNVTPMRRAFEAGALGNKNEYDGLPTERELRWACRHLPGCGPFFLRWMIPYNEGGSADNPSRPAAYNAIYPQLYPYFKDQIRPGVNSYILPRFPDGSARNLCGQPFWVDYNQTAHNAAKAQLEAGCHNERSADCATLCEWGHQEYCSLQEEMSKLRYCKQYGGHPNVPACQFLCATGKPEYQQYCSQ